MSKNCERQIQVLAISNMLVGDGNNFDISAPKLLFIDSVVSLHFTPPCPVFGI